MADSTTADPNNNTEQPKKLFPNGAPPDVIDDKMQEALKNLTVDDLVRGTTPKDIEERCLSLCQAYIGGTWSQAKSTEDVVVKRISGGLTNQLYHVQLKDTLPKVANTIYPDEPTDVAIKLYQAKHMKNYEDGDSERLSDIIVLTIISQVGIGPKVYGIFNDGVILAYHKHEQFRPKHQKDAKLLKELAQLLAKIHHLNVPIRKNNNWLLTEMRNMLNAGYANTDVKGLVEELDLKQFKNKDLADEFEEFEVLIKNLKTPIVFCHNDFRGSNILVTEPNQKILLCDLEYSSYGARGFDMAVFLTEWERELFDFDSFTMPETEVIENFVKLYIEECNEIVPGYAEKPENQLTTVVNEAKIFFLANFMFFLVFMFKQTESLIPQIPYDAKNKMKYIDKYYANYLNIKKRLIDDKII